MQEFDVIILGAGAAGLMCAAQSGQLGRRVLLIDHAEKAGKKILISGGGRCNFTNIRTSPDQFLSQNPHFVKSALKQYTAQDFINLVNQYGIAWHEKTLGQLFCDGSARQIVSMLLSECEKGSVDLRLNTPITNVSMTDGQYVVNQALRAPNLIVATGGPSIPKMGSTGFAYELAKQFEINVIAPRPALVPLTLRDDDKLFKSLSGVSTETIAKLGKVEFKEASLFTHKGLSGPAILQISSYWREGEKIALNLTPNADENWLIESKRRKPRSNLKSALSEIFPNRLAEALSQRIVNRTELANIPDKSLKEIMTQLRNWIFAPNGTEGFAKAEVTAGGIDTNALSSKTMETKNHSGLFFIGEAVDVTGWLGGYNFQWAWSSAWVASQNLR